MIVSPNDLRRSLVALIKQIDAQIAEVEKDAASKHIAPTQLRDTNGGWVLTPLLLAKAQAYGALVQINERERK
jgi:hypothetical protein